MITDTGIGISPDFLSHIFENFSGEKNSSLSGVYGAGLGLPVVKKLLELMGGTIHVESSPGKGTRVTVEIPHKIVEREELLRQTKYEEHISKHFIDGKRVLLAEDNDLNAEIPIVAITANALEEDKKMAYAAGMNGHVAKPIDVTVLMDTLFQFIE